MYFESLKSRAPTHVLKQENFGQKKVSELRDSTLFLFVLYCLSLNYIHTGALESQTNYNSYFLISTLERDILNLDWI